MLSSAGLLAVPIGAFAAWRRGGAFDVATSAVTFVLYAAPTFAVAMLLRRATTYDAPEGTRVALAGGGALGVDVARDALAVAAGRDARGRRP